MRRRRRPADGKEHVKRLAVQGKRGFRPLITALLLLAVALCVAGVLARLEPLVWIGAVPVLVAGLLEMTYRL